MREASFVQKLWNFCDVLRDDGVSYQDYVEQLTYLLFLKMADERNLSLPEGLDWQSMRTREDILPHYRHVLETLGKEKGILGSIFAKSQNRIQDPAKLTKLLALIDGETWSHFDMDVKGEVYEGLLQKNAEDTKSGAGQYFTPRPLIKAIVEVMQPRVGMTVCDPACGTGGFLLAACEYMRRHPLTREQEEFLRVRTFRGCDIVEGVVRLCAMNLYLHGIGGEESPLETGDSLTRRPHERFDMVLTNPPFGRKSTITLTPEEKKRALTYERPDFWVETSNKQLNFVQHVKTLLNPGGRAAMVVPDNVLFEGGAGETVRRNLLSACDVHTLLRLPAGIFYAQGVKANVLFFDNVKREHPATDVLWVYDLRTNKHFTKKENPLRYKDLEDFISCYNPGNRKERKETERFKSYTYGELMERENVSLDICWLKDERLEDMENLPHPDSIAETIVEELKTALNQFTSIHEELKR